jgi:hypothetical protein
MDNQVMQERNIVADYLRHPDTTQNIALETLFITTGIQVEAKQYSNASDTLATINAILDGIEQGIKDPFSTPTLAADYFSIASLLKQQGYEAQWIETDGNNAVVYAAISTGPSLLELHLTRSEGGWSLSP